MKLSKIFGLVLVMFAALQMTACSWSDVPPAHKGKILTTAGYSPDVLEPGRYTLWGRDQMVTLEAGTNTFKENVTVKMADKLTLKADVRFTGRVAGTPAILNAMFNDIPAGEKRNISFGDVYRIYGQPVVRNKAREVLSKYTIEDIHVNYHRISGEISEVLIEALKNTPLEISNVNLGDIEYPDVVNDAINAAAERDLAIAKEEAQQKIEMTKKKNERALAEADYQIQITKAKAVRDANKILGQGITPELLALRNLEVLEKMAENNNAVFMPYEALQSPGANIRMFNQNSK